MMANFLIGYYNYLKMKQQQNERMNAAVRMKNPSDMVVVSVSLLLAHRADWDCRYVLWYARWRWRSLSIYSNVRWSAAG